MPSRTIRKVIENQQNLWGPGHLTVREAACLMTEKKVGAILIVEADALIGIFTERDLLNRVVATRLDPDTTPLTQVMTPDPITIHPDKPFAHALHMMYEGCFRHLPVAEDGRPVGMVSVRDALGPELVEFESELVRRDELTELIM